MRRSGVTKYDAKRKRDYYLENRDKRLAYQNSYYRKMKSMIQRRKEIDEALEPDRVAEAKKKLSDYNRAYYIENRTRILAQRSAKMARQNSQNPNKKLSL